MRGEGAGTSTPGHGRRDNVTKLPCRDTGHGIARYHTMSLVRPFLFGAFSDLDPCFLAHFVVLQIVYRLQKTRLEYLNANMVAILVNAPKL